MKGKPMKKIATLLAAGVIVAVAAVGCSVEVTEGDGGTASGGTGGTSTGGTGGTGGTAGAGGTGGSSGSGGTAGTTVDGGGGTGGSDSGAPMCVTMQTDPVCNKCAFSKCQTEHCACNAASTCRGPMATFYMCLSMPNADSVTCATTFTVNANVDGGGGLANDLATCMLDECDNTCAGRDASNRNLSRAFKSALQSLQNGGQR
jgi:hypothetical protein